MQQLRMYRRAWSTTLRINRVQYLRVSTQAYLITVLLQLFTMLQSSDHIQRPYASSLAYIIQREVFLSFVFNVVNYPLCPP